MQVKFIRLIIHKLTSDYAHAKNQPVGVAIVAFNRPDYLKQLLQSIETNSESQQLPFFFFWMAVLIPDKMKIYWLSMIQKLR